MNYADIKKIDVANGEGVRVSLFVSGCNHHCKGCFNQCAWDFNYGNKFTEKEEQKIIEYMDHDYIEGLSLLGGEPLEHRLTKFIVEADALCGADGHIPFFQHAVFPGILEQCRNIRSHKVFALAPADDQRAFPLDCKNGVRVIPEQHGQRIAAAHLGKRLLQCTQRVTGIAAVDQLYQHFGVRLTLEGIAFCGQALLEQAVIFNDAIVHNAHTRGRMRVAVHIAGLAMGSPAGVADAAEALCQLLRRQLFPQGGEPSFAFYHADAAVQRKRHTGGVVPAILQLFQTIQQHRRFQARGISPLRKGGCR